MAPRVTDVIRGLLSVATLFLPLALGASAGCNETDNYCNAELSRNILAAYSSSNISVDDATKFGSALATAVAEFGSRCRGGGQVLRAVRLLTPSDNDNAQGQASQEFTRATGYRVVFTSQPASRIAEEVLFQMQTNVSLYDGWVLDSPSSEAIQRAGGVALLDRLVAEGNQSLLADDDVHPFFQQHGAMYDGNRTGILVSGQIPLLYWRRDYFARFLNGLDRAPSTWEELLAVAAALNGTDFDGDGRPDAALCWQSEGCVDSNVVLSNILASMTQYQGRSTGWLLNPPDLELLAAGPPLVRALELFRRLTRYEARGFTGCQYVHNTFFTGPCAMTVKWGHQFKRGELSFRSLHGNIGVAPLPGSTRVWDRGAGAWLDCGDDPPTNCPYADLRQPLDLSSLPASSGAARARRSVQSGATSSSSSAPAPAGSNASQSASLPPSGSVAARNASSELGPAGIWVNRAPYAGMTALVGTVDVRSPDEYKLVTFTFFEHFTAPLVSWFHLGMAGSGVGPFRRQHLDSANIPRWLAMGYNLTDLKPFLSAWLDAIEHPNAAMPLRLPGTAQLLDAIYVAAQQALGDAPLKDVADKLTAQLKAALEGLDVPPMETKRLYWGTLGYESAELAPHSSDDGSWWSASRAARVGVGIGLAVTATAVLLLVVHWWYRRRRRLQRRTLFGKAMAPGASPATSLVVTDIVDSTRLWETVPQAAMARAVQLHHETLRSLLDQHNGYESATEGDSFILSFYTAADAVAFALRAQAALLRQPWPAELLQEELCQPQYAVCRAPGGGPDRARSGIPRPSLLPSRHQLTHTALPSEAVSLAGTQSQLVLAGQTVAGGGNSSRGGTTVQPPADFLFGPAAGNLGHRGASISGVLLRLPGNAASLSTPQLTVASPRGALGIAASGPLPRWVRRPGGASSGAVTLTPAAALDGFETSGATAPAQRSRPGFLTSQLSAGQLQSSASLPLPAPLRPAAIAATNASVTPTSSSRLGKVQPGAATSGSRSGDSAVRIQPPPLPASSGRSGDSAARLSARRPLGGQTQALTRGGSSGLLTLSIPRAAGSDLGPPSLGSRGTPSGLGFATVGSPRPTMAALLQDGLRRPASGSSRRGIFRVGASPGDGSGNSSGSINGATGGSVMRARTESSFGHQSRHQRALSHLRNLLGTKQGAAMAAFEAATASDSSNSASMLRAGMSHAMAARASVAGDAPASPTPTYRDASVWASSAGPFGADARVVYNPLAGAPDVDADGGLEGGTDGEQQQAVAAEVDGSFGAASERGRTAPIAKMYGSGDSGAERSGAASGDVGSAACLAAPELCSSQGFAESGMAVSGAAASMMGSRALCGFSSSGAGGANGAGSRALAAGLPQAPDKNVGTLAMPDPSRGVLHSRRSLTSAVEGLQGGGPPGVEGASQASVDAARASTGADGAGAAVPEYDRLLTANFSGMWTRGGGGAATAPISIGAPVRGSSTTLRHAQNGEDLVEGTAAGGDGDGVNRLSANGTLYVEADTVPNAEGAPGEVSEQLTRAPTMSGGVPALSAPLLHRSATGNVGGPSEELPGVTLGPGGRSSMVSVSQRASVSGALTSASLAGVMPYRRTSVPHNSALMSNAAANSGALESAANSNGGLDAVPIRSITLGAFYQQLYRVCPAAEPGAVMVGGGLQVRMGIHSGVASTQVSYNRVAGRTQYSGAALEGAKAVCDAAQGGMVLLSQSVLEQLTRPAGGAGGVGGRDLPHVLLDMGTHVIKMGPDAVPLYMAQSRELMARLAFLGPIRSTAQADVGVMEAPLGEVSMAALTVVGLPTLMAWDKDVTEEALATFRRVVVTVAMRSLGGHLVEDGQGKVLAAFGHPYDAIRWVAACEALLKEADWSEALLGHELAEEVQGPVLLNSHMDAPVLMADGDLSRMLFRGLRIKGAVDCASVRAELVPATGRLAYRGNLVHNVQRIAAYVSTGQVVCTRRAWRGYEASIEDAALVTGAAEVVGASLGCHSIRSVGDKIELYSIRLAEKMPYDDPYDIYDPSFHHDSGTAMLVEDAPPVGVAGPGGGGPLEEDAAAAATFVSTLGSELQVTAAATAVATAAVTSASVSAGPTSGLLRLGPSPLASQDLLHSDPTSNQQQQQQQSLLSTSEWLPTRPGSMGTVFGSSAAVPVIGPPTQGSASQHTDPLEARDALLPARPSLTLALPPLPQPQPLQTAPSLTLAPPLQGGLPQLTASPSLTPASRMARSPSLAHGAVAAAGPWGPATGSGLPPPAQILSPVPSLSPPPPPMVLPSPGLGAGAAGAGGGDPAGGIASRLGHSLAGALRVHTTNWDVSGEDLRNMLSD